MTVQPLNVVYDCNVFIQALINKNGPAGACVRRVLAGEVHLFLSERVLEEVRAAPEKRTPARLGVTHERVGRFIENLLRVTTLLETIPVEFIYLRDPDDAHYVNLALVANAKLVVSRDKDLLALMDAANSDGRDFLTRFPRLRIVDPVQFLQELDASQ